MFSWHYCSFFFFFFSFIFISWRLITLQYCSGFCHTLAWIIHGFTCIPHPDPPSHQPPSLPDPSGSSQCMRQVLDTIALKEDVRSFCPVGHFVATVFQPCLGRTVILSWQQLLFTEHWANHLTLCGGNFPASVWGVCIPILQMEKQAQESWVNLPSSEVKGLNSDLCDSECPVFNSWLSYL